MPCLYRSDVGSQHLIFTKLPEYTIGLKVTVSFYVTWGGLAQTTVVLSTGGPPPKDPQRSLPSPLIPVQS